LPTLPAPGRVTRLAPDSNDPSELLEVFDSRGQPTGRAKSRGAVHRDGDWHQSFHCWIVRPGRHGPEFVLQRRSPAKDSFPGYWDATAAGHWRFGETPPEAARELAEELGLDVDFGDLAWRGRERIMRRHPNGLVEREYHQVYLLRWPDPLATYGPDPREVTALAAVPAGDLIALAAGQRVAVLATEAVEVLPNGALQPVVATVRREEFVPYSAARLRRLLQGD
jgi:isopentenyldiphosphate isomerase